MVGREKARGAPDSSRSSPSAEREPGKGGHPTKGLQRTSSMRLKGEVPTRREPTPGLRRERTDDSLRGGGSPALGRSTPLRRSQSTRSFALPRSPPRETGLRPAAAGSGLGVLDPIARNGTTFSSRCNKYVVHCGARAEDENYLTPTQRSARDLKRLRLLLDKAYETIRYRDAEISRLKQHLSDMRSRRRSPPAPAALVPLDISVSSSSDAVSVVTAAADSAGAASPDSEAAGPALTPSVCGDSGTCDCLTPPSVSSGPAEAEEAEKLAVLELEERLGGDWEATEHWIECEEQRIRQEHELRVGELNRQHSAEYQEMKEKYNDRVESLLQQLAEANTRYFELRPAHDAALLRSRQLELMLEARPRPPGGGAGREMATQTPDLAPDPDPAEMAPPVTALIEQLRRREQELDRVKGSWGSVLRSMHGARSALSVAGLASSAADLWTAGTRGLQKGLYQQQLSALEAARLGEDATSPPREMDAPTRLQFLRSAVYHCLTDRDGYAGHLKAIAALLRFSEWEVQEVERARGLRA